MKHCNVRLPPPAYDVLSSIQQAKVDLMLKAEQH